MIDLSTLTLYTDQQAYAIVHLPKTAITAAAGILAQISEPFSALLADKDEVTLVLLQEVWADFAGRLPDHRAEAPYRLITFDTPLEMTLVGFLAEISRTLAEAGISLMAFSAYSRDHLLVPAKRFDAAWSALEARIAH